MSSTPEQEPSIEEILSSIRQIISDDDEVSEDVTEEPISEPEPGPEPEPEPEPEAEPESEEAVLELTEAMEEELDVPEPEPKPEIEVDLQDREDEPKVDESDSIFTDQAASATMEGFTKLASNLHINRSAGGVTLEDIVYQILTPMLREWVDSNMEPLVGKLVQEELDRIARKATGKKGE